MNTLSVRGLVCSLLMLCFLGEAQAQISPVITISRSSGVAPLAVTFDALATTGTSLNVFHELHCEWDFGDSVAGTKSWTFGNQGLSRNVAHGCVAAHLFTHDNGGAPFTVRVTVRDKNGNSGTATRTVSITSPDNHFTDSKTYCYANNAGTFQGCPLDNNNDGACDSQAGNCKVTNQWNSSISNDLNNGRRFLFRAGDTFLHNGQLRFNGAVGPGLIGSFPSGAKYTITSSSDVASWGTDWRFVDVDVVGSGSPGTFMSPQNANSTTDDRRMVGFTLYNVTLTNRRHCISFRYNMGGPVNGGLSAAHADIALVDFTCKNFVGSEQWVVFGGSNNFVMQNADIDGGAGSLPQGLVRSDHNVKSVIQHNRFSNSSSGKSLLSLRACRPSAPLCPNMGDYDSSHIIVSDNLLETTVVSKMMDMMQGQLRDVIVERNFGRVLGNANAAQNFIGSLANATDTTIRNNIAVMTGGAIGSAQIFSSSGTNDDPNVITNNIRVYNNTLYTIDSTYSAIFCRFPSGSGHECRNNLIYAPNVAISRKLFEAGTRSNNLYDVGSNPGVGTYTGNPFLGSFPSPAGANDFRLAPAGTVAGTSPVSSGIDLHGSYYDFGINRRTSNWDVGAFEFGTGGGGDTLSPAAPGNLVIR